MNDPTPPPWEALISYISASGAPAAVMTRYGELIAELTNPADAALIAAAPLLLDACKAVLREDEISGGELLSRQTHLLVQAAILKAKRASG
jgi:hypothetical protein